MTRTLCAAAVLISTLAASQQASAATYVVEQTMSPYLSCYNKEYVPARVLVNTQGHLVRGSSVVWQAGDTQWNQVRNPPVYIQTRKVIAPDHYTLVKTDCPN